MLPIDITALQHLPEITVRSYREADFDAAYRMIRAIGEDYLGRDLRAWDKSFMQFAGFMWVAQVADTPVAFAGLSNPGDGFAYLVCDLVAPEYQRRGIGTLLTLTRFAAMADDQFEGINVLATDHSVPFYARFGFQPEGPPEIEAFGGHYVHRLSMSFTPELGQSADSLIDGLTRVTFDMSIDEEPFVETEGGQ